MTLSRNKLIIAAAAALSAAVVLTTCHDHERDSALARSTVAAPEEPATAWERISDSTAQREAELAYRACAREAALRRMPVREFPETSERVTYLNEHGKRIKRSEHVGVAIDNMQVDNGCATQIVRSVSIDVLSDHEYGGLTPDETGRTVVDDSSRRALPVGEAQIQLAISRKALPPASCTFTRDVGMQSHFMMLNLCWHEEKRAEAARLEELPLQPKKAARPATAS
ncbi:MULTISPECIES: hypothetical protein [unclassified Herbaspirillum]|uniref:hypothetical protein n=1 Tax=unclassified Herbaspirillum TaxID=2624150 RepID=UPI003839D8F4